MFFWKKSPTVKVRCYPQFDQIKKIFPIEKTQKFIPEWWKKLDSLVEDNSGKKITTIKSCPGFTELYKRGITIPLWRDSIIKRNSQGIIDVELPTEENPNHWFVLHPEDQYHGLYPGWTHIKIISPWFLETEKPIPFLMIDMIWNRKDLTEYVIPQGILEFKYQHATHINIFLPPVLDYTELHLSAGTPMVQLIPLDSVDIDLEICDANSEKFKSMLPYAWTFHNVYSKTRNILESVK